MSVSRKNIKIAIVEDDKYFNLAMTKYLQTLCNHHTYPGLAFTIVSYLDAHSCIEQLDNDMDILILDYFLYNEEENETLTALDIINSLGEQLSNCKILIVSSQQSAQTTVQLMKSGIYDYVDKTVSTKNRIGAVVQKILKEVA